MSPQVESHFTEKRDTIRQRLDASLLKDPEGAHMTLHGLEITLEIAECTTDRAKTILKIPRTIPWVVQILRLNLSVGLSKDEKNFV